MQGGIWEDKEAFRVHGGPVMVRKWLEGNNPFSGRKARGYPGGPEQVELQSPLGKTAKGRGLCVRACVRLCLQACACAKEVKGYVDPGAKKRTKTGFLL